LNVFSFRPIVIRPDEAAPALNTSVGNNLCLVLSSCRCLFLSHFSIRLTNSPFSLGSHSHLPNQFWLSHTQSHSLTNCLTFSHSLLSLSHSLSLPLSSFPISLSLSRPPFLLLSFSHSPPSLTLSSLTQTV
jgi:hypothetical protein